MITQEWLETEIKALDELEESAAARAAEAKRAQTTSCSNPGGNWNHCAAAKPN